jgi:hypothetical protein
LTVLPIFVILIHSSNWRAFGYNDKKLSNKTNGISTVYVTDPFKKHQAAHSKNHLLTVSTPPTITTTLIFFSFFFFSRARTDRKREDAVLQGRAYQANRTEIYTERLPWSG